MSLFFQNKILTPHRPLCPASVSLCTPAFVAGGGQTRQAERGWGSIFWKTREIGLPSYNDLSTTVLISIGPSHCFA